MRPLHLGDERGHLIVHQVDDLLLLLTELTDIVDSLDDAATNALKHFQICKTISVRERRDVVDLTAL